MRHDLLPLPSHGVFPAGLGRAVCKNALVIAGIPTLAILVLLASLAVHSLPARAEEQAPPAGLFFRSLADDSAPDGAAGNAPENALQAPVLKTDVAMTVNGMVSRVTVHQVFRNPTRRWLEGIYVFPLPERSAVDRLTMTVGDRRIEGRILEKAEAERVYREAAEKGQRASLVSGKRPNVFVTNVANIGPGQEISVEIGYQDAVAYDNGVFSLRFPMVVAPRYSPAPPQPDVAEAPARPQPVPVPDPAVVRDSEAQPRDLFGPVDIDADKHNPLSLTIDLNAGLQLASLRSLYHPVVIESAENGHQTITLQDESVPADRDFVLEWTPVPSAAPQAAVFGEQVGEDSHLMVMMLPPIAGTAEGAPKAPQQPARPREVIFVIDTSGSMFGGSIEQAKAAVIAALKRLKPEDRFNVIQFNDRTHALFPRAVDASVGNVAQAWHYVSALEAEGGTEMRPALEQSLANQRADDHLRQVVFLTDAAVGNEAELFRQVAERLGDSRLFTVGIGSAPNSYFMRKAAELGRGSFTYIGKQSEVESRIEALLTKLEQPALTDIRAGWPLNAGKRIELYPTPLPDLYAGEPVTFTARLKGVELDSLDGQLLITGDSAEGPWQQRLPLGELTAAPGVASLWARAKLVQIEDGLYRGGAQADKAAIRAEALGVALEHGLVTRYTSLVAVDEEVARPQDERLATTEIERDLPHGWDAGKVFGAQETLPAPTKLRAPSSGAQAPLDEAVLRGRALPGYLVQQAKAAGGQAVSLPQTATPAQRMTIVGGAYLFMAVALVLLVLYRRRQGGLRG